MKLIFLHGLPGVGKLTVATELAQLTGFKVFHNHLAVDLAESVFEFGSERFVDLREMVWLAVLARAAEAGLPGLIFTFAFDRTVRTTFIPSVQTAIGGNGGQIFFVELRCSQAELERRISEPSRQKFGKLNSAERFHELSQAGTFIDPGIPADKLVVDTTDLSPSVAARLIASELKL